MHANACGGDSRKEDHSAARHCRLGRKGRACQRRAAQRGGVLAGRKEPQMVPGKASVAGPSSTVSPGAAFLQSPT